MMRTTTLMLLLALTLAGCATQDVRYPQCARMTFLHCLDMDGATCDGLMAQAQARCEAQQNDNTLFETMPDRMKEGHRNRCMANEVAQAAGQPEDKVKSCLRW